MFVGGQSLDSNGNVINGTRWDYYTSIFVSVELVGTIGKQSQMQEPLLLYTP